MKNKQHTPNSSVKAAKKKKMAIAIVVMCVIAVIGMFFLNTEMLFDFSSEETTKIPHNNKGSSEHIITLYKPDWNTNIFERADYLDKNRYLTFAEGGMELTLVDGNYSEYGDEVQLLADYFDALMQGDAEKVCSFYADSYFESHDRWEKITMQKLYDMKVEFLNKKESESTIEYYYRVSYKIMENDGTFRDDLISDAVKAQFYVITDFGYEMKITDVSYKYQGN